MAVELRRTADKLELTLTGEWAAQQYSSLAAELAAIDLRGTRAVSIDTRQVSALEISGAYALRQFVERAKAAGVEVSFTGGAEPPQLELIDETLRDAGPTLASSAIHPPRFEEEPEPVVVLTGLGRYTVGAGAAFVDGLAFLGRVTVTALATLMGRKRLRPTAIARHVYETGITAMPIVALIAFLISVIIAYMSAQELRGFGADIYVVDLVTIGVLRELGVLLTAIIVAGRSGSAFAAELGSMQLNEEVDALIAGAVDPYEVLVLPRVLGLVIALPLLAVVADLVGLTGGAVLCRYLLDMPLTQYASRVNYSISSTTFWVGIIKAPVFAVLIANAGCYRGLQVRGSARELGRLVTVAVVQSIFLVILADALFAVLFLEINV
ncbi:MAG TPA: ABC transporter permease [Steroidobacteraceae bacterium]|nr:ABC transporter permease [Steroidobacteraceae bacterium]